jgi:hypothetical protein
VMSVPLTLATTVDALVCCAKTGKLAAIHSTKAAKIVFLCVISPFPVHDRGGAS